MFNTKAKISIFTTISIIASAIFLFLMISVLTGMNLKIDNLGAIWSGNRVVVLDWFFKIFTYLGSVYFMIGVSILLLIFMRDKKKALAIILCLMAIGAGNYIVKIIVRRPRPDYGLIEETGNSFPSGHAMIGMGFYGFLIYLSQGLKKGWRLSITITLSVLIFLLGISRVYLGVHFLSDIMAGWCLGFVGMVVFILLYELIMKKLNKACQKQ